MNPVAVFLILVLLVALWWLIRKRNEVPADTSAPRRKPKSNNTQFHAVSITHSGKACKAAMEMSGRRFLATAAPKLPLPECDILECNCRFAHHDDRRSHKDRRSPFGPGGTAGSTGSFSQEQRSGADRRRNKLK
ncbi:MAG: hypothetical protein ACR2QL_06665 [Woeseiaceae bacterium]